MLVKKLCFSAVCVVRPGGILYGGFCSLLSCMLVGLGGPGGGMAWHGTGVGGRQKPIIAGESGILAGVG